MADNVCTLYSRVPASHSARCFRFARVLRQKSGTWHAFLRLRRPARPAAVPSTIGRPWCGDWLSVLPSTTTQRTLSPDEYPGWGRRGGLERGACQVRCSRADPGSGQRRGWGRFARTQQVYRACYTMNSLNAIVSSSVLCLTVSTRPLSRRWLADEVGSEAPIWAHEIGAPEQGCLLVASQTHFGKAGRLAAVQSFTEAVVLLVEHGPGGSAGLILNRQTPYTVPAPPLPPAATHAAPPACPSCQPLLSSMRVHASSSGASRAACPGSKRAPSTWAATWEKGSRCCTACPS